jgi:murein DD-endopeptidase MepM/ murein hydrolase activator NlpD
MAPLPAALTLLATGAALALLATGAAPSGAAPSGASAALDTTPVGRRASTGIVAARADPRPSATVPPAGSPAGVPPGPAGDPVLTPSGSGPASTPSGGFDWPVAGTPSVVRRFAPGPNPWSAGHRGVDVTGAGSVVLAAGAGSVTFAGTIAGRGVVVVRHNGALRTTYEPVSGEVTVGQVVARGQQIGRVQPVPGHCPEDSCLHWGARIGERYLDPLILLGAGRRPPVLLPQATAPGRPAGRRWGPPA